jgi:hypothetical protein
MSVLLSLLPTVTSWCQCHFHSFLAYSDQPHSSVFSPLVSFVWKVTSATLLLLLLLLPLPHVTFAEGSSYLRKQLPAPLQLSLPCLCCCLFFSLCYQINHQGRPLNRNVCLFVLEFVLRVLHLLGKHYHLSHTSSSFDFSDRVSCFCLGWPQFKILLLPK